jgi:hypothetical protein
LHVDRRCPWRCSRGALIRHDDHVTQDSQTYPDSRSRNAFNSAASAAPMAQKFSVRTGRCTG